MTRIAVIGPGLALGVALGAALGWTLEHYRLSADLAEQAQAHDNTMRQLAERHAEDSDRLQRDADALQQQLAGLDAYYTQELTNARNQTNELRDAVDAGHQRLRILAKRPEHCPTPTGPSDYSGLDTGTAVELAGPARAAYFRLRDGITADTAKLQACQALLQQITAQRPP